MQIHLVGVFSLENQSLRCPFNLWTRLNNSKDVGTLISFLHTTGNNCMVLVLVQSQTTCRDSRQHRLQFGETQQKSSSFCQLPFYKVKNFELENFKGWKRQQMYLAFFTRKCNYECGFCFHTAKTSYLTPLEDAKIGNLWKINFICLFLNTRLFQKQNFQFNIFVNFLDSGNKFCKYQYFPFIFTFQDFKNLPILEWRNWTYLGESLSFTQSMWERFANFVKKSWILSQSQSSLMGVLFWSHFSKSMGHIWTF